MAAVILGRITQIPAVPRVVMPCNFRAPPPAEPAGVAKEKKKMKTIFASSAIVLAVLSGAAMAQDAPRACLITKT